MATTVDDQIFIDTNVLVYAKLAGAPLHELALRQLTSLQRHSNNTPWISRQVMREYLVAMSRPGVVTPLLPITALVADVQDFSRRFRVADDNRAVTEKLLGLLQLKRVSGKQIHDANIVATMQAFGINQLLTHNVADFVRYSDLIRIVPLQA